MATLTDPAKELASICKRLAMNTNVRGAQFLAEQFDFKPWSTDFYRVILSILRRADQVSEVIGGSRMDDDHKEMAVAAITEFKTIFTPAPMSQEWNTGGGGMTLAQANLQGITFLSHTVRSYLQYPELSADEVKDMLAEIDQYISLLERSSDELPFVRRAIQESLLEFAFRLRHLGWLGADYTLAALRDVTSAYYALERNVPDHAGSQPIYEALKGLLGGINRTLSTAREWKDNVELAFGAYKLVAPYALPLVASGILPSLPALPSP